MGFSDGRGYEFTIDSEIVFEIPEEYDVHHQIFKSDNNTYFFIDAEIEYHPCPDECDPQFSSYPVPWQGDRFIETNNLGEVLWEWNTFDWINLTEYNPRYAETYSEINEFDWTHANSVLYDPLSESVYVSFRNLCRITSIDYSTGQINWNLGESDFMENPSFQNELDFSQQHSAQLTPSGNLIFFDNGIFQNPELSRCIEVEFDDGNEPFVVWQHVLPDSMFTGSRGECDRLTNGNTLISAGRTGNIIEVDNNNELIWHLKVLDNNENEVSIYRTQRALNLFPNIFSFQIEQLNGEFPNYLIINNQVLDLIIYNHGWAESLYEYTLSNEAEGTIINGEIQSNSIITNYTLDLSNITLNNDTIYNFKIASANNENNFEDVNFYFQNDFNGDINNDGNIDILDIINIVNYITTNQFDHSADFNEDEIINIQDIIILINFILIDNFSI